MALNKQDFPDPNSPIIPIKSPFFIFNFIPLRSGTIMVPLTIPLFFFFFIIFFSPFLY